MVKQIAEAQQEDAKLKHLFKCDVILDKGLELQFVRKKVAYAIKVGWLYPSHCYGVQSCGITTIFSPLGVSIIA
jgi:hypothetical protein